MSMAHGEPGTGNRDVIVIAGHVWTEAVTRLARRLPADLLAAVLVAIHRGLDGAGLLGGVLAAAGRCPLPWPRRASHLSGAGSRFSTRRCCIVSSCPALSWCWKTAPSFRQLTGPVVRRSVDTQVS